jgi:hypothetical protein
VLWQAEQFSTNSSRPLAALVRSIGPNTSSGHFGGASRRSSSSIFSCPRTSTVDSNSPCSGDCERRSMRVNTPIDSVALRNSGSLATPLHWTHADCGAFQRNGGLAGASAASQFSGRPRAPATTREWMSVRASMRPGPLGVAIAASREM